MKKSPKKNKKIHLKLSNKHVPKQTEERKKMMSGPFFFFFLLNPPFYHVPKMMERGAKNQYFYA